MKPKIITLQPKKLVGKCITTTLSFDDTAALWHEFMRRREEIKNRVLGAFYSVQVYPKGLSMQDFREDTEFERWAAVEVSGEAPIPNGFNSKKLVGGTYAVFKHVGPVKTFVETSNYIYGTWLPNSSYTLDDRAHFERLGEKYYGPEHPESEEEIWVPVKQ